MEIGVFAYVKVITLPVIYSLTCVPRIYSCRSIMVLVQCTYHGSSSIWIPINYSTMYQCIMTHDLYVYLSYSHELIMSCILYHLLMDISWSIILIMYLWIYLDLYSYHVLLDISWSIFLSCTHEYIMICKTWITIRCHFLCLKYYLPTSDTSISWGGDK